jgi:hypothetical protein
MTSYDSPTELGGAPASNRSSRDPRELRVVVVMVPCVGPTSRKRSLWLVSAVGWGVLRQRDWRGFLQHRRYTYSNGELERIVGVVWSPDEQIGKNKTVVEDNEKQ